MITDEIYKALRDQSDRIGFFAQAFTTTGHPVAVAVALRAQQLMEERDILGHVREVSPALLAGVRAFADHPLVGNVRGVGLMAAVELVADKATRRSFDPGFKVKEHLRQRAQEHGLVIRSGMAGDVLAFSPPLDHQRGRDRRNAGALFDGARRYNPLDRGAGPERKESGVSAMEVSPIKSQPACCRPPARRSIIR